MQSTLPSRAVLTSYVTVVRRQRFIRARRASRQSLQERGLELELDNLRAALAESIRDPDPEPGLRLATALWRFWPYRHPSPEGVATLCALLDRPDAQEPTATRGHALLAAARLLTSIPSAHDAAAARAQAGLATALALSDEHLRTEALHVLALISVNRGDQAAAFELTDKALEAARRLGDPTLTALVLTLRSTSPRLTHAERVRACEEALRLLGQVGNQTQYLRALNNLAYAEMDAGQIASARARLRTAVTVAREIRDQRGLSLLERTLGFASYLDGDIGEARARFGQSLSIAQRTGERAMEAHALLGLALASTRSGQAEAAAKLHGAADLILEELGTRLAALESRLRERDIASLKATLNEAAFEAAYGLGRNGIYAGMPKRRRERSPSSGITPPA